MPSAETVGLYLDSKVGYALNMKTVGTEIRILGYSPIVLPDTNSTSEQDKRSLLVQELKRALNQANVRSKNISVSAPGDASMTRYFEIPILTKKEEKNVVKFEAQKYVPFDIKELYYSYERYPDTARKKTGIVFMAVKKQWADMVCSLVVEAGYKVASMELMSQTIAKTYQYETSKDTTSVQVLISANDEKTAELIISQGSSILVTRHLTLTTNPEATQWDIPMLVSEIRLSFEYFSEILRNQAIGKICLLMEKTEQAQKLEGLLRSEFTVPVEIVPLLPTLGSEGASVSHRAAAYGLSINKAKSVNLLSEEALAAAMPTMSWDDEKRYLQDLATKAIIGTAAFLFVVYLVLNQFVSSKNAEVTRLAGNYPKSDIVSITEPLIEIKNKESLIMQRVNFAVNFFQKRPYLTNIMNELPRIVPANILLTQMKYESSANEQGLSSSSLHLEGFVLTAEAGGSELSHVNKLVQQLSENKDFMQNFDEIKINSTKRSSYKGAPVTRFSLDCFKTKVR